MLTPHLSATGLTLLALWASCVAAVLWLLLHADEETPAETPAQAIARDRSQACRRGQHRLTVDDRAGVLRERCLHCNYLVELGHVWFGASNHKTGPTP